MSAIGAEEIVARLVTERPGRARVFERFDIDYCCGGNRTLAAACAEKGLEVGAIVEALVAAEAEPGESGEPDWSGASLAELCDHIVDVHHDYLRRELPRLAALVEKVVRVHAEGEPSLPDVQEVFEGMAGELEAHMWKEEEVLFPAIRDLERAGTELAAVVAQPIRLMEHEHEAAGASLARLRELTHGYTPPQSACNSYRAMLDGLASLELDLHRHIHEENNVLFPRALGSEAR